jgi:hypothetical protein
LSFGDCNPKAEHEDELWTLILPFLVYFYDIFIVEQGVREAGKVKKRNKRAIPLHKT